MPDSRTVIEHLLDSRDALLLEVTRLTMAINELDSVIVAIGGDELRGRLTAVPVPTVHGAGLQPGGPTVPEPINPRVEVEADAPAVPRRGARAVPSRKPASAAPVAAAAPVTGRRAPATVAAGTGPRTATPDAPLVRRVSAAPEGQKSIRVHVLDMLAAENRDFGLAEIIERIHAYGIAAHDDAVRSITIKLMKDGKVERVGRGQYRLARRSTTRPARPERIPAPVVTQPVVTQPVVAAPLVAEPVMAGRVATGPVLAGSAGDAPRTPESAAQDRSTDEIGSSAESRSAGVNEPAGAHRTLDARQPATATPGAVSQAAPGTASEQSSPGAPEPSNNSPVTVQTYPPPLNLAQPWDRSNR